MPTWPAGGVLSSGAMGYVVLMWETREGVPRAQGHGEKPILAADARSSIDRLNRLYPGLVHWAVAVDPPMTPPTSPRQQDRAFERCF